MPVRLLGDDVGLAQAQADCADEKDDAEDAPDGADLLGGVGGVGLVLAVKYDVVNDLGDCRASEAEEGGEEVDLDNLRGLESKRSDNNGHSVENERSGDKRSESKRRRCS